MARFSPLKLTVKTVSGKMLGHVVDVEVDTITQAITAYHVKSSRLMPDMVQSPLLISPSQVREITLTTMIVDDTLDRQAETQPAALPSA